MKNYKTVFDKAIQRENAEVLPKSFINESEKDSRMLLHTYNTEIFDPKENELSEITPSELDVLMIATRKARKQLNQCPSFSLLSFRIIACAASMLVVCSLVALFFASSSPKQFSNVFGNFNTGEFRGGNSGEDKGATSVTTNNKLSDINSEKEPLAYIVDANGDVAICRGNERIRALSSCDVLYADDVVVLGKQSQAKIMYEDAFFDVGENSEYRIASPSPLKIEQNNMFRGIEPTFTTRGAKYNNKAQTVALAPKILLAQIVSPITRAGDESLSVYSPKGASFTNTPVIHIGGNDEYLYEVTVLDILGEQVGKKIQIKGNSTVEWAKLSKHPLQADEIYNLKVTLDKKIVNDANNASFWLVSAEESKIIQDTLKRFNSLESQEIREFFKANTLFMNGCYAEARFLSEKLIDICPNNKIYINLNKLCNKSLGIKGKINND